jgi:hypothetical protein
MFQGRSIVGRKLGFLTTGVLLLHSNAWAQTRLFGGEITSGSVVVDTTTGPGLVGVFDMRGSGFHIVGVSNEPGQMLNPRCEDATPLCVPGLTLELSSYFQAKLAGNFAMDARVVVNGEVLEPAFVLGSDLVLRTDPVTIPNGFRKNLVITVPFRLELGFSPGTTQVPLDVYTSPADEQHGIAPWASGVISGSGVATAFFERFHTNQTEPRHFYRVNRIVYSFQPPGGTP